MFSGRGDDVDAARSRRRSRAWRRGRATARGRGHPRRARPAHALDRHALCRPVALAAGRGRGPDRSLDDAVARFHDEHEREHAYRRDDAPVELNRSARARSARRARRAPAPRARRRRYPTARPRPVRFDGRDGAARDARLPRDELSAGRLEGPAVIDQLDSTVLVPPGVRCEVDEWLNLRMHLEEDDDGDRAERTLDPVTLEVLKNAFVHHRRRDGRADPAHLPLVRHLLARLLVRAVRRQRQHRDAGLPGHRRPRRHAAPQGQGGHRGLRRRHPRGRPVRHQRSVRGGTHFNDVRIIRPSSTRAS